MKSKKKLLTSAVALGTAAAMVLGGTFAWQSINQTALNEASDIVNPGGRLHNDQNWVSDRENNTDIYVENFTDPENGGETIFARVRLSEYMEIVMNQGVEGAEVVETVAGKKFDTDGNEVTDKATDKDTYTYQYDIHYFDRDAEDSEEKNATSDFFKWTTGEEDSERPYFIPTYNMNKDSLLADLNGAYVDSVGGISNRGEEQYEYDAIDEDSSKSGYEVYDGDVNTADEVGRADLLDLIENGTDAENYATYAENVVLTDEEVEHTARQVGETRDLISMENWLALTEDTDRYWVYDTDGWVYWSSPIEAGETTGLLLDGFTLNQVMDDTWYYAIDVEAQFVTANDVGKDDNTGFYDTVNGTAPTANAEKLLESIGVEFGEGDEDDSEEEQQYTISFQYNFVMSSDNEETTYDYTATLLDYGETYSGDSAVTWDMKAAEGYTIESGKTTISGSDSEATITLGKEMEMSEAANHKVFVVTAYLDGTEVVSADVLVLPFRSENNLMYGFTFWNDGVETAADKLQTGVTYELKAYTYLYLEGADQDVSDVFKPTVKPADMTALKVFSNPVLNIEAAADEVTLAGGKLTVHKSGEYTLIANLNDVKTAEYAVQFKVNATG